MVTAGGRPRVIYSELDVGVTVESFPGVYVGTLVQSKKGEVGVPVLNTTINQYLERYTFRGKVNIGDDLAHYGILETLRQNNKVYTIRVARNPLYGGVYFKQDYPISGLGVTVQGSEAPYTVFEIDQTNETNADLFYNSLSTGDTVRFVVVVSLPGGILAATDYYVIKLSEYQFMVASSYENAIDGIPVEMTSTGAGFNCNLYPNSGSALLNGQLEYGISNPDNYQFDTSSGKELNISSEFSIDLEIDEIVVDSDFYNAVDSDPGDTVLLSATTFPTVATGAPLDDVTEYYITRYSTDRAKLSRTLADAQNSIFINFTSNGVNIGADLQGKSNSSSQTPDNTDDTFTANNSEFYPLAETGDKVTYTTADTFPTVDSGDPFSDTATYYLIKTATTNEFQLARTFADANGGIAIGFSDDGVGTQSFELQDKDDDSEFFIVDLREDDLTVDENLYEQIRTPNKVTVLTNNELPDYQVDGTEYKLQTNENYYAIRSSTENSIKLALTESNARLGIAVDFINGGVGTHTIQLIEDNEPLYGVEHKCLLLVGKDQGNYNNEIYVETLHYPYGDRSDWTDTNKNDAALVGETNSFIIYVYRKEDDGTFTELESWLCSRDRDKVDARGVNIYVESVLEGSSYIKAINNLEVHKDTLPINQTTKLQFANGNDGDAPTTSDMITAVKLYENSRDINIDLLLDLGYNVPAFQKEMVTICENRIAYCALSSPLNYQMSTTAEQKVVDFRRDELNVDSSFASLWANHLKVQDQFNNRIIYIDPTGYVGSTMGRNSNNFEFWTPPAGKYGILNVIGVVKAWTEGEMDDLYNNQINFAENVPAKGIRLGGQKTLYSRNSPLSRINARIAINVFTKLATSFLEEYLYSVSNEALWNNIASGLSDKLEELKNRNAFEDYYVKCDAENNPLNIRANNILQVDVILRPAFVVEYIKFRNIITSGSVNISYDIITNLT